VTTNHKVKLKDCIQLFVMLSVGYSLTSLVMLALLKVAGIAGLNLWFSLLSGCAMALHSVCENGRMERYKKLHEEFPFPRLKIFKKNTK
jgi:Flp pilus assembly protein TadB